MVTRRVSEIEPPTYWAQRFGADGESLGFYEWFPEPTPPSNVWRNLASIAGSIAGFVAVSALVIGMWP